MEIKSKDIQFVSPASLIFHPKNMNKHRPEQIERLCKLIEYQGFRQPLVVQSGTNFVVAGNGRLEAAIKLNLEKIPVTYQEFDSEAQLYAFMVSDNAIAKDSWASIDEAMILENKDLLDGLDLDLLGIDDFELPEIKELDEANEDTIPENVETRSKLGDVWQLGEHRLMCGDSTSIDAVNKLMNGQKADITFTSPPYNIGSGIKENGKYQNYEDNKSQNEFRDFLSSFTNIALIVSDYVFSNIQSISGNKTALIEHLYDMREKYADTIIWDKESAQPAMARRVLNSQFEYIHIFSNEAKRSIGKKDFRGTLSNVFKMSSKSGKEYSNIHKATFPVSLPEHFLLNFTVSSCFDPFGGSGSTLIACEKTNRKCYMMELDPHYVDVILARWEKYTGKVATRLESNS